jgi:Protein of unknown function (DUF2946).
MRLTTRGGYLRSVTASSLARLVATLAFAVNLLVHLSPLWVPAVERGGIEVCAAYGLTVIPDGTAMPGRAHDQHTRLKTCPLCAVYAATLLVPTAAPLPWDGSRLDTPRTPDRSATHTARAAGLDHLSRAPPSVA